MATLTPKNPGAVLDFYKSVGIGPGTGTTPLTPNNQSAIDEFYRSVGITAPPPRRPNAVPTMREQRAEQLAMRMAERGQKKITTPVNVPGQPNGTILTGKDESQLPAGVYPAAPGRTPAVTGDPLVSDLVRAAGRAGVVPPAPGPRSGMGGGGGGGSSYTIKAGDTLSDIAKAVYGNASAYRALAAANGIADPNRIRAGQTIQLPPLGGATAAPPAQPATPAAAPRPVQSGSKSSGSKSSGSGSGGGGTILGSSTRQSYNVGQTYSSGGYRFVAQADGTFKNVGRI